MASLKAQVLEYGDFQEAKKSVDDYHMQKEQELEDEKEKLEKEKDTLNIERYYAVLCSRFHKNHDFL